MHQQEHREITHMALMASQFHLHGNLKKLISTLINCFSLVKWEEMVPTETLASSFPQNTFCQTRARFWKVSSLSFEMLVALVVSRWIEGNKKFVNVKWHMSNCLKLIKFHLKAQKRKFKFFHLCSPKTFKYFILKHIYANHFCYT